MPMYKWFRTTTVMRNCTAVWWAVECMCWIWSETGPIIDGLTIICFDRWNSLWYKGDKCWELDWNCPTDHTLCDISLAFIYVRGMRQMSTQCGSLNNIGGVGSAAYILVYPPDVAPKRVEIAAIGAVSRTLFHTYLSRSDMHPLIKLPYRCCLVVGIEYGCGIIARTPKPALPKSKPILYELWSDLFGVISCTRLKNHLLVWRKLN